MIPRALPHVDTRRFNTFLAIKIPAYRTGSSKQLTLLLLGSTVASPPWVYGSRQQEYGSLDACSPLADRQLQYAFLGYTVECVDNNGDRERESLSTRGSTSEGREGLI